MISSVAPIRLIVPADTISLPPHMSCSAAPQSRTLHSLSEGLPPTCVERSGEIHGASWRAAVDEEEGDVAGEADDGQQAGVVDLCQTGNMGLEEERGVTKE